MKLNLRILTCLAVLGIITVAAITTVGDPVPPTKPGEVFGWGVSLELILGSAGLMLMGYLAGREQKPTQPKSDPWMRGDEVSDEALAKARAESVKAMVADGRSEPVAFTCDTCDMRRRCTLAFDPYNTDGDCLWNK